MDETKKALIDAFKAHAIGERRKHEATLDILLSSPVIIPSHTDIFDSIQKEIDSIGYFREQVSVIDSIYQP